jgi:trigger factor
MNSQATELKIAIEQPRSWARRLTITVPAERVARERKDVARRLSQQMRLPGFRQGKVPPHLVEQRFGAAIDQEALERLVNAAYKEALEKEQLQPISQGEVENVDYKTGSDLTFDVEFEVRPEIELTRVGGFTVERSKPAISDEEVEGVLARVRQQHAAWQPVEAEAPVNGDRVVVEITPLEGPEAEAGGKPRQYEIVLGEDQALPPVEEAIRTLPKGEEGEFTLELPEPEEEGKTRTERIRIRTVEVMRPELPTLDDDFARSLGDFEGLEALRARIRIDLEQEAEAEAERDVRRQLLDQILEANPFEVPDSLINRYLDQLIRPRPEADAERLAETRQLARPAAEQALRRTMVIERVAELEGLHATSAEVDARVEEIAERGGRPVGEVWSQLQKSGRLAVIEEEITEDKVFTYLKAQSTIA